MPRLLAAPALVGLALAALPSCGGSSPAPRSREAMLDDSAVGKSRCREASRLQDKPFVVEWDSTDLAGFEALAARDLVFVRYAGCELEVLSACTDGGVPGRFGRYGEPRFTSGARDVLEVRDESELYAKLPLGVASFGGRVARGEALALEYYVTGVATATRDAVPTKELQGTGACRGATHFVQAYRLGAFELSSSSRLGASADVGVGDVGGGAKHEQSERALKRGGDLASCKTQAQTACRSPIRLVLRPLGEGSAASGDAALGVASAAPPAPPASFTDTPQGRAMALRQSASQKESRDLDGVGCLADLDRADALDPSGARDRAALYTRSVCLMRAGRCDEGERLQRDYLRLIDEQRQRTDAEIDLAVSTSADSFCPSTVGTPAQRAKRSIARVNEALARKRVELCLAEAKIADDLAGKLASDADRTLAASAVMLAARCAATLGRCDEGGRLWSRYYELQFSRTMKPAEYRATAKQVFQQVFPQCH